MFKRILSLLMLVTFCAPVLATDDIPDLVGTWTAISGGIIYGPSDYTIDISHGEISFIVGSQGRALTLIIEEQNGRSFAGQRFLTEIPENSEVVIGVIAFDNETLYMVDEDGYIEARLLSPTEIEFIYREVDTAGILVLICKYTKN